MSEYIPSPIDLTEIELNPTLLADLEKIAQNIHDTWARQRFEEGWRYGPSLDRQQKLHPCMTEYENLPESEKDVDRATVLQTIKMLIYLGYEIKMKEETPEKI